MADVIRLTAQEVETVATKFNNASDSTQQLLDELGSTVESMSAGWEGDAYNAFVESFGEIKKNLQSVVELYDGLSDQLRQVVKTLQETDSGLASSLRG